MIYVFLAIIVLIVVFIAVYFIYTELKLKWTARVISSSKRLLSIQEVNKRYEFCGIQPETRYCDVVNSKQQLDNFNFHKHALERVKERCNYYNNIINNTNSNISKKMEYDEEITKISDYIDEGGAKLIKVPYNTCHKIERALCEKELLKPVVDPKIIYTITYTSPAGRNRYVKEVTFHFNNIVSLYNEYIKESQFKETATYQRRLMTKDLRYRILQRDGFRCKICGRSAQEDGVKLHVDHIIPVSKGGKTVPENLQTLCEDCNLGKSNKM